MAAFSGGETAFVSTTWTEIVAAPASGRKQVLSVMASNRDTVAHLLEIRLVVGASNYKLFQANVPASQAAQMLVGCIVLDNTNESLEVKSDGAASVTEPLAVVAVFEEP